MKRILSGVLLVLLVASMLASCSKKAKFEDVEYKDNGICFSLPNTMVETSGTSYDFYFTGMSKDVVFGATKITEAFLLSMGLDSGASAGDYVDAVIEKQGLDKSRLYYTYDEDSGQHNFRYNYGAENEEELFYYVTVLGAPGNMWCVEMCCRSEESYEHLEMFEDWRKTIRTYS